MTEDRLTRLLSWMREMTSDYGGGAGLLLAGRGMQLVNSLGWSVVLIRRFGLGTVGTFALGMVGVAVLTTIYPLGLPSFLPRLQWAHAKLCCVGLIIELAVLPLFVAGVFGYAKIVAQNSTEERVIFLVALSGIAMGLSNTGLMLSIMAKRFRPAAIAPLCESIAIVISAIGGANVKTVAAYLLISRFAGALIIWSGMRLSSISLHNFLETIRSSVTYLAPDAIAMISEQIAPLMLQGVTGRAGLGLFRLCQQILTACDTPGWSFVQSRYPELVQSDHRAVMRLDRSVKRLALGVAVVAIACGTALSVWIYHLPRIIPMILVLSSTIIWRYRNNLYDQSLRATGRVSTSTILGIAKFACASSAFYALIHWLVVWGAVIGLAVLSIASGITYQHVYSLRGSAERSVAEMATP